MRLLISIVLVVSVLLGGCAAEGPKPSTPTPSPTVTPGNESNLAEEQDQVIYGKVYPGEAKSHEVLVGNVTRVSFELKRVEHKLGLTLTPPSAKPIYSSVLGVNPNISCGYDDGTCGGTQASCTIDNPEQGKWIVHVSPLDVPPGGKDYLVLVSFETEINFSLNVYPRIYTPGEPIRIMAGPALTVEPVRTMAGPAPTTGSGGSGEVITWASVVADIVMPGNVTERVVLYDDGLHGDSQADDGTYTNVFTDTSSWGIYGISLTASGTENGVKFQKRDAALVWVSPPPDLSIDASDIVFSNDNPYDGESISITATVHNIGEGDATFARIRFYYDERWRGEISVPIIRVPAGGTAEVKAWWVAKAGDHNIYVNAENLCSVEEQNLSNNESHRPIHVSVEANQ